MNWSEILELCRAVGKVEVHPPATGEQIRQTESALGRPLPPEYRELLEIANGAVFDLDPPYGAVVLAGAGGELEEEYSKVQSWADSEQTLPFVVIGYTGGVGYHICLADDGAVWIGDDDYNPEQWLTRERAGYRVADSLESFLRKLAAERGRFWWEAS